MRLGGRASGACARASESNCSIKPNEVWIAQNNGVAEHERRLRSGARRVEPFGVGGSRRPGCVVCRQCAMGRAKSICGGTARPRGPAGRDFGALSSWVRFTLFAFTSVCLCVCVSVCLPVCVSVYFAHTHSHSITMSATPFRSASRGHSTMPLATWANLQRSSRSTARSTLISARGPPTHPPPLLSFAFLSVRESPRE